MPFLKNAPIFVTGGAGFIGANFVHDWIETEKTPVIVLDKLTYAGKIQNLAALQGNPLFEFIETDIGNSAVVERAFFTHHPRAVVNFAAETHGDRSIDNPVSFIENNVLSTARFLQSVRTYYELMQKGRQEQFRMLHLSTDEVYGALKDDDPAFTEQNQFAPNNPYAASKAASDHLVRAWHQAYGLPIMTINSSNNYGPYQFPEKLIPFMIMSALTDKALPIYGDGLHVRDWLYVKDHCTGIRDVLRKGAVGETYNIGGGQEKSNIHTIELICDILDDIYPRADQKSYREQIIFVSDRAGHDRRYAINTDKISRKIGWRPQETFETGILKTVEWYLDQTEWLQKIMAAQNETSKC